MAFIYKLIAQVIPGTAAAEIYASATNPSTQTIIRQVNAINIVGSNVTFDLFQNGSATINKIGRGTTLVPANNGTADGAVEIDCYTAMQPADTIFAKAGATNAITLSLWGVQIT